MAANGTLFTNDTGAQAGAIDYVKDVFLDVTDAATTNAGLTDTAATNPLGFSFANDDIPRYGAKTLYIKDLVLVADRSKWINAQPTYTVVWTENFPAVKGYVFGTFQFVDKQGQQCVQMLEQTCGFGVNGIIRKVDFLVDPSTAATATATVTVDGASPSTPDFSSQFQDANAPTLAVAKHLGVGVTAANQTKDLHDFRISSIQFNTLSVMGVIAYFENSGANIEFLPGTTYVDKSRVTTALGATLALPAYGSSLGGHALLYKTSGAAYAMSAISASTIATTASGTKDTNLITVAAGTGASFAAGYGVIATLSGSTNYVGSVVSVSTDTLTMSATLPFALSNTPLFTAWRSGQSLAINASLMTLAYSIDATAIAGASAMVNLNGASGSALPGPFPILDPQGRYALWGSNLGYTTTNGVPAFCFLSQSGFLQVDGYFSAAEFETTGGLGQLGATVVVNGGIGYSVAGVTGALKKTVFTDAGPGWNSFQIQAGASMGIGFARVNLYTRSKNIGITAGALAEFDTLQAPADRYQGLGATFMAMGTERRIYADQLYLKNRWDRGFTTSAAGGIFYYGTTTTSVMKVDFYGKNFAIIGTAGGGALTLDGVGIGITFNTLLSAGTEGFHTVQYTSGSGATSIIQAFDYTVSNSKFKILANTDKKIVADPVKPVLGEVYVFAGLGHGSASNNKIRTWTHVGRVIGNSITYVRDTTNGDRFLINRDMVATIAYADQYSAGNAQIGVSKNSIQLTTGVSSVNPADLLIYVGQSSGLSAAGTTTVNLKKGDVIRCHDNGTNDSTSGFASSFRITEIVAL